MRLHRRTRSRLEEIAEVVNAKLRGWIAYFGRFRRTELSKVLWTLDCKLVKWLLKKYKSLKGSVKRGWAMLERLYREQPDLFAHWKLGFGTVCR